MLGLCGAQAGAVSGRYRLEAPRVVGGGPLRRRGPLFQVVEDLGVLFVQGDDATVLGAAADQPHSPVVLGQVAGETAYLLQGTVRIRVVAAGAEGVHVAAHLQGGVPAHVNSLPASATTGALR